jgi:hypothetical protein
VIDPRSAPRVAVILQQPDARNLKPEPHSARPSRPAGVYAGSTLLPLLVLGRHRRGLNSSWPCGFARPGVTRGDTGSVLVMMGSPVRVRASAWPTCRDFSGEGVARVATAPPGPLSAATCAGSRCSPRSRTCPTSSTRAKAAGRAPSTPATTRVASTAPPSCSATRWRRRPPIRAPRARSTGRAWRLVRLLRVRERRRARVGRVHGRHRAAARGARRAEQHHRQRRQAVPGAESLEQQLGRRRRLLRRRGRWGRPAADGRGAASPAGFRASGLRRSIG